MPLQMVGIDCATPHGVELVYKVAEKPQDAGVLEVSDRVLEIPLIADHHGYARAWVERELATLDPGWEEHCRILVPM